VGNGIIASFTVADQRTIAQYDENQSIFVGMG
jgi:hypothetical protein